MQRYKNLATKLHTQATNNFAAFTAQTNLLQFTDELQPKSYYDNYKQVYRTALLFGFLSQVATAISSFSFFDSLFSAKIENEYLRTFAVLVLLSLIEIMKFVSFNKALQGLFALPKKPNYALLAFGLILSVCSIYASLVGGRNLGIDTNKVVTVKSEFDTEIATLRTEIADIKKRNTYKGNTYIAGKDKKLLHAKEQEIRELKEKKQAELNQVNESNEIQANTFQIGFGFFDLLFILCSVYVWYFKHCCTVEYLANNESQNTQQAPSLQISETNLQPQNQVPNQNANGSQPLITKNPIGFEFKNWNKKVDNENRINENRNQEPNENRMNGNRICLHCNTSFIYNAKKQKYCSDNCRVSAWELKTKRVLQFKNKKYSAKKNTLNTLF